MGTAAARALAIDLLDVACKPLIRDHGRRLGAIAHQLREELARGRTGVDLHVHLPAVVLPTHHSHVATPRRAPAPAKKQATPARTSRTSSKPAKKSARKRANKSAKKSARKSPRPRGRAVSESTPVHARTQVLRELAHMHREDPTALLAVSELRKRTKLPKELFDEAVLFLGREGLVSLHHHDFPASLKPEDRERLVVDKRGTHYVGIALKGQR
jgi:hypothetical protein